MLYLPIVALLLGKALHTSAYPQAWGFGCDHIGNACSDEDTSTPELFYDGHCQNGIDDNDGTKTIYQALSEDPKCVARIVDRTSLFLSVPTGSLDWSKLSTSLMGKSSSCSMTVLLSLC
jgi:hypothetical protein